MRSQKDSDSGLIVIGWVTKLVMTFAVLGLLLFDGFSIVAATFSASDRAGTYASDAADSYHATHDVNAAYALAVTEAKVKGDTIDVKTFTIDTDGTVHLTVHHTAESLWMKKISALKKYTVVTETGQGAGAR